MNEPPQIAGQRHEVESNRGNARNLVVWLATGLGIGFVGIAPGTLGAVEGLLLAWGLASLTPSTAYAIGLGVLAMGVPLCTQAARRLGGKDPQAIVWDELATMPIVFTLVPLSNWKIALLGFLLHRVFDISKPWPCYRLERLPEGLGIMADDVAASIYAAGSLFCVMWLAG